MGEVGVEDGRRHAARHGHRGPEAGLVFGLVDVDGDLLLQLQRLLAVVVRRGSHQEIGTLRHYYARYLEMVRRLGFARELAPVLRTLVLQFRAVVHVLN